MAASACGNSLAPLLDKAAHQDRLDLLDERLGLHGAGGVVPAVERVEHAQEAERGHGQIELPEAPALLAVAEHVANEIEIRHLERADRLALGAGQGAHVAVQDREIVRVLEEERAVIADERRELRGGLALALQRGARAVEDLLDRVLADPVEE